MNQQDSRHATIGIDLGSTTIKLVALGPDSSMLARILEPTEPRMEVQARRLLDRLRHEASIPADSPIIATGYGRQRVPEATRRITEISAHAAGLRAVHQAAGTLIDIGGQDTKVIVLDPRGMVLRFTMNDKCAAGTGRFLEVASQRLGVSIERFGALARAATEDVSISNTCTVFAESEIISSLAEGHAPEAIARGLRHAMIRRVVALARSISCVAPLFLSGGVALDPDVANLLSAELGLPLRHLEDPQILGALGAARSA